jgi:hypothetical protein
VVGAKVTIAGDSETREVATNNEGRVELGVTAGLYRIKVYSTGFCEGRHAAIRIQPSIEKFITLQLVVCPTHTGPRFSEEFFAIGSSGFPLNLLIRFIKKSGRKELIQYENDELLSDNLPKVVASYDSLTIYALKMKYAPKKQQLEAEGDVVVENNGQRTTAARLLVDFGAKEPVIKYTQ